MLLSMGEGLAGNAKRVAKQFYLFSSNFVYLKFSDSAYNLNCWFLIIQNNSSEKQVQMCDKQATFSKGVNLAYYSIRGTVQVCRLLCQYLHIPYKNVYFTPQTWNEFKVKKASHWNYQQLPFLMDEDRIVTQTFPMCLYLILKANCPDLLGKNNSDRAKVDMFVWDVQIMKQILSVLIALKNETIERKIQLFTKYWNQTLKERLTKLQNQSTNTFYLSYLSIVDFYIYDIFYMINLRMPEKLSEFPKLTQIFLKVSNIPEIAEYEKSSRSVRYTCPLQFCEKWKSMCQRQCEKTN